MKYTSTRGGVRDVDFSTIVFSGYAPDGGLYVPQTIPVIDQKTLLSWSKLSYSRLTSNILALFANDAVRPYLDDICDKAFSNFENPSDPIPIKKVGNMYIAETFRGPTLAFKVYNFINSFHAYIQKHTIQQKDIGLNILSQIMELLLNLENKGQRANVLVETSGDTGPAAVASVMLNTTKVNVFCMFPFKQVTKVQARQLTTMMYKNDKKKRVINVYATDRNSDDQCLIIKNLFNDIDFVSKNKICAMNSINFVRIASQICYYFYAYLQVVPQANKCINFAIPSGAFGNSCAATFAKKMGLPINYLIPCCNENNIVFRTLMFGDFSSSFKDYHLTKSPAMDVQIAYNMERFFWLCLNMNGKIVKEFMNEFEQNSKNMEFGYKFDEILRRKFNEIIKIAYTVNDEEIKNVTKYFVENYNYLACPHSACSLFGAVSFENDKAIMRDRKVPLVAIATAHPGKFPNIIREFLGDEAKSDMLQKEFEHPFLPKVEDKEECIKLESDQSKDTKDNWSERWTQKLRADIMKENQATSFASKL